MSDIHKDDTEEVTDEQTSTDSSTENETGEDNGSSSEASQSEHQTEDFSKVPLDKHPRWQEREKDWNKRFEDQDAKWEAKLAEIQNASNGNANGQKIDADAQIPSWFGGNATQWAEYIQHNNKLIEDAEKRAFERFSSTQSAEKKAIDDANKWFEDSVKEIETESGTTVDRNALLKIALDNELIDSKGRWNYKAAFKILKGQTGAPSTQDRKKLADATTTNNGTGSSESKKFKTSEDFKKDRPW